MNSKIKEFLSAAVAFSMLATGCSSETKKSPSSEKEAQTVSESSTASEESSVTELSVTSEEADSTLQLVNEKISSIFSDSDLNSEYDEETAVITLDGESAVIDGSGAVCEDSVITITDGGVYRFTGTLTNGRIIVDSAEKVHIILDNADITCKDSAPVYVANADKTFITLADNSENTLTDGSSYTYENETVNEPDAVIFSHDSLTLNGTGTLNINANYNEGITSKDDIVITGGTINISSVGNGIKGKNYTAVCNAEINIDSQADGLKSTNITDAGMGFVYAESGTFNITAAEDGIQAETVFIAKGGSFNITSGGGIAEAQPQMNNDFGGGRGFGGFGQDFANSSENTADTVSIKGIKSGMSLIINGGTFNIDSADDALHSNLNLSVSGGDIDLFAGGDAVHADAEINISGGNTVISNSSEGIEGAVINVSGGTIDLTSSDDGFNASDGTGQGAMGTYSDGVELNISGGTIFVNAGGDGLDSNGNITISGGTIHVDGPTNNGNGALDGNAEIIINGGELVAAGSSGMAESPSNSSSQHSLSASLDMTCAAGTVVTLCDSTGKEIISYTPSKTFDHVVISSPEIKDGETYVLLTDGTEAGSFTADSMTSYIGSQGMMNGGFGGGRGDGSFGGGGFGGGYGDWDMDDIQLPTDENGEIQMPTNENGEIEMPEMPQGGFGGGFGGEMIEPPTGEDGMPEMPQGGWATRY